MSSVNLMAREVGAKIVFYGPGLSGKTTTLRKIYETVRPAHRGEMMSLATEGDRTLFFDFLPVKVEKVGDCTVRLALYTVPGQVFYNATRKLVLQGADGVVFVADSQPAAADSNRESLQNLEENLLEQGLRLDRFPLVIQYNKRDVPGVLPVERLRSLLNPRGVPDVETCATSGHGVLDSLKAITRLVIQDLRNKRIVPSARTTPGPTGRTPIPTPEHSGFGPRAPSEGLASLGARLDGQMTHEAAPVVESRHPTRPGSEAPTFTARPVAPRYTATPAGLQPSTRLSPVPTLPPAVAPSVAPAPTGRLPTPALGHPPAPGTQPSPPSTTESPTGPATEGTSSALIQRAPAVAERLTGQRALGAVSALAPNALLDYALAAEAAFEASSFDVCVHACREGLRRALAYAGEGSEREQAFMLRVDGPDLLRLQSLETRQPLRVDDAAFALYAFMQVLTRLGTAGLPE